MQEKFVFIVLKTGAYNKQESIRLIIFMSLKNNRIILPRLTNHYFALLCLCMDMALK